MVNTATGCELDPTIPRIARSLPALPGRGWKSLDIPCNQFMGQAPGTADEINSFCSLNYQTTFHDSLKPRLMVKKPFLFMTGSKPSSRATRQTHRMELCKICHRPTRPSRPTLLLQNRASCHGRLDPKLLENKQKPEPTLKLFIINQFQVHRCRGGNRCHVLPSRKHGCLVR